MKRRDLLRGTVGAVGAMSLGLFANAGGDEDFTDDEIARIQEIARGRSLVMNSKFVDKSIYLNEGGAVIGCMFTCSPPDVFPISGDVFCIDGNA